MRPDLRRMSRRGGPAWARRCAVLVTALLLAALLPLAAAQPQGAASEAPSPQAPSEAERLVFQQDHLAQSRRPLTLRYAYVDEAAGRARVTDQAVITLRKGGAGGCCDAHGEYLSGPLAVNLPDIPDARANPVLLYFLEGEVRLLQRTTTGQAAHFRRRIRLALAENATISEGTVRWAGRDVPARTVRVAPFLTDPFRARFQQQAATEYAIVLSEAVPGGVYQMTALLPGAGSGAAPLARRTLTIEEAR